jgi:hypothetical protein
MHCTSITKTNQFRKITALYFGYHTKLINILYRQSTGLLIVKTGGIFGNYRALKD